ncbi:MAG TPA: glycosyltransferase family 4 protein [Clostridia bacterium]|nr:glycosyltransferase family 4 protein [Clostridia bacterium]
MNRERTVLVPRFMDSANVNAQNLNAKAMLSRFSCPGLRWSAVHYGAPDSAVERSPNVSLHKLWHRRLWRFDLARFYKRDADAIFYPGPEWFDAAGLALRSFCSRRVPVIATLEGLVGDEQRERELTKAVGHVVICERHPRPVVERIQRILARADLIVAISPFLQKMGTLLYGDKFVTVPLGIDGTIFHSRGRKSGERRRIVSAGTIKSRKRPLAFIELAAQFPQADFVWFGSGPDVELCRAHAAERGIVNVTFAGLRTPAQLADEFRRADLFAMTSFAEGVPKVMQEAAACGLPIVAFGFYEAPSVVDGVNGYVVWDDEQMCARVGEVISNPERSRELGSHGASMAREWDWDQVAPRWEEQVISLLS